MLSVKKDELPYAQAHSVTSLFFTGMLTLCILLTEFETQVADKKIIAPRS